MESDPKKHSKKSEKKAPMPAKLPDITRGVDRYSTEPEPFVVPPSKPYQPPRPLAINQVLDGTTKKPKFFQPKTHVPGNNDTVGGTQYPNKKAKMTKNKISVADKLTDKSDKLTNRADKLTDGSDKATQTADISNQTVDLLDKKSAPEGKTKGAATNRRTAVKHTTGINYSPIKEDVHPAARKNIAQINPNEIPDKQKTTADFLYEYDLLCLRDLIVAIGDLMTHDVDWDASLIRCGRSSRRIFLRLSASDRARRLAAELSLYRRDLSDIDLSYLEYVSPEGELHRRQLNWSSSILPGGVLLIGDVVLPKHLFKDPFLAVPTQNKYSRATRIARRLGINPDTHPFALAAQPAFENCTHVLHLRTGIVWRTQEGNLHFHGPVGGPVARLAFALRPEVQDLDIYHTNAEAPFSITADRRLDEEFWRAAVYRYGRLQGWERPATRHVASEYVVIDDTGHPQLTKRQLLTYLIKHVLR
jgi:hypothetical protein